MVKFGYPVAGGTSEDEAIHEPWCKTTVGHQTQIGTPKSEMWASKVIPIWA